jgi:hypothetical protein
MTACSMQELAAAKKENTANNYRYDRQARTVRSDAASRSAHPFRHTHIVHMPQLLAG